VNSKEQRIKHEQNYIAFLEKRLASKNFKANSTPEEYEMTEKKLKKARLVFKMLK
jgi:hypothetical protein